MIIKPPHAFKHILLPKAFIAGSIEMGLVDDWQAKVCRALDSEEVCLLNPRRDAWDSSWEQTLENPNFVQQVDWEMDALITSQVVLMYFHPATKAPITLLELGLGANNRQLIVCCPEGFWRKGNVDMVCRKFGVSQVPDLDALIRAGRRNLYG